MLNAGRGNPNFLNTEVRKSFALLTLFAAQMAQEGSTIPDVGYRLTKTGLSKSLRQFLKNHQRNPGGTLLDHAVGYAIDNVDMDADELVFQLVDGIQADFYPDPPRIFPVTEQIVRKYLDRVVFSGAPPKGAFHLFATEGATAAMIYIFNSLRENMILNPGDKVAHCDPDILALSRVCRSLRITAWRQCIFEAARKLGWQVPDSEVAKIERQDGKGPIHG